MTRQEFASFLISWGFNGTGNNIERMNKCLDSLLQAEYEQLNKVAVISSDSNIVTCDNCGNDNVDDGKHKYNMERCRCCQHYL